MRGSTLTVEILLGAVRRQIASWKTAAPVALLLSVGVGVLSASSALTATVLMNPLRVDRPEQLFELDDALLSLDGNLSAGKPVLDYSRYLRAFRDLAAFSDPGDTVDLEVQGETTRAKAAEVSSEFFATMRIQPIAGRLFDRDEQASGRNRVVLFSERLCRDLHREPRSLVGETVVLNRVRFSVVGVIPERFRFPADATLWIPISLGSDRVFTGTTVGYAVFGRLAPGVTKAQAEENVKAFRRQAVIDGVSTWPSHRAVKLLGLSDRVVYRSRLTLLIFLVSSGLIWLATTAHAGHLTLVAFLARSRETAIRVALGASPRDLAAQYLAEGAVLGVGVTCLGIAVCVMSVSIALSYLPHPESWSVAAVVFWTPLGVLLLSLGTGLACVAPALRFTGRLQIGSWLATSREIGDRLSTAGRASRYLIVSQVAVAVVLVVAAIGLTQRLVAIQSRPLGFSPSNRLAVNVHVRGDGSPSLQGRWTTLEELLTRIGALPGVRRVGATNLAPLISGDAFALLVEPVGRHQKVPLSARLAVNLGVTSEYLRALGVSLLEGRLFSVDVSESAPPVAVITENLARSFWGDAKSAIGRQLEVPGEPRPVEVIGVVRDMVLLDVRTKPLPQLLRPYRQAKTSDETMIIECAGDSRKLIPAVRAAVSSINGPSPVGIESMESAVGRGLQQERLLSGSMAAMALVVLALAAVGLYATTMRLVAGRQKEIAVRIALGAQPWQIITHAVGLTTRLAGVGLLVGLLAAAGVTRMTGSALSAVGLGHPAAYAGGALCVMLIVAVAAFVPARRAIRIDPIAALRTE